MIAKLFGYLYKLTLGGGKESSKRFIALFMCILVAYVVIRYTTVENIEMTLVQLLTFIVSLLGIASYESHKGVHKNTEDESNES